MIGMGRFGVVVGLEVRECGVGLGVGGEGEWW